LEFAIQAWNPHYQLDIDKLEHVQQRATSVPLGFSHVDYDIRCRRLQLTTLKERRTGGNLIQQFKFKQMHRFGYLARRSQMQRPT
jgi:hypothetical protein